MEVVTDLFGFTIPDDRTNTNMTVCVIGFVVWIIDTTENVFHIPYKTMFLMLLAMDGDR
jgi:hypothetical protein